MTEARQAAGRDAALDGRPELIFFDIGDTLIRVDPSWPGAYFAAATSWGLQIDPDALAVAFARALREGLWDSPGPFEASPEGSFRRIKQFDVRAMALLGYEDLPDEFYRHLGRFFEQRAAWHVFPDVQPALEAIAAAGIRRAVISNWVWALPELLHDLEIGHHFEAVVASARVGYVKPQREIFQHALDLTGIAPERAMHVGDNLEADVAGAGQVGMRTILLDRGRHFPDGIPGRPEVPVVPDLLALVRWLGIDPDQAGTPSRAAWVPRGGAT